MRQEFVFLRRVIALSILCLFLQKAMGEPLYPLNNEYRALPRGTTFKMFADWRDDEIRPSNIPDRSYKNIWIRMFPLLSVPLGDPYPETVNPYSLTMVNSGGLNIFSLHDGSLLTQGTVLHFDFAKESLSINGANFPLEAVWIHPHGTITTTLGWDKGERLSSGKPAEVKVELRGGLLVKRTTHAPKNGAPPKEYWSAINVVTVNEYLLSVVPSEVIASWKPETLKAQAIAARTYGLYEVAISRTEGLEYDVDPSTWFQSYQGVMFWMRESSAWKQIELSNTSAAVQATEGKVILHAGEIIKAYFSSNSGGQTCTAGECLETGVDPAYLREIDDAPGVQNSPGGTWGTRANLTPSTIKAKLKEHGLELPGTVKKLEHLERGPSNRTWRLRVVLTNGNIVNLDRQFTRKIMHLFGPIRSFQYELGTVREGRQSIRGHGYGHGVGMSQWGAQLFAKNGWNAERILSHFYYNVSIKNLMLTPNSATVVHEN